MQAYKSIVVIHPAAIGDAVMGTPVPRLLKRQFPHAKIVYLTHPSLFPLLELCQAIDVFVEWNRKTPLARLVADVRGHSPDLVIDLVGSLRTRLVGLLSGCRAVTYRKQRDPRTWSHVVDNYLSTLAPLGLTDAEPVFPTLVPPAQLVHELMHDEELGGDKRLIALVPGVGKHRPNRAWPAENWAILGEKIAEACNAKVVLVGGTDDQLVCAEVESVLKHRCLNLAGKMSLTQTAALLSCVDFVVSGDTGPAHIATAIGKKVIALMGPTTPSRTGPYRMESIGLNVCAGCKCSQAKRCLRNDGRGPGECMKTITVDQVLAMVADTVPYDGNTALFAGFPRNSR